MALDFSLVDPTGSIIIDEWQIYGFKVGCQHNEI